jgi:hypothetical protein
VLHFGWLDIFAGSTQQFTLGLAMIMLMFDCALFFCLICYLDSVLPTDDSPKRHPLFFLQAIGSSKYFSKKHHVDNNILAEYDHDKINSTVMNENMEHENANLDKADIIVYHMSKQWSGGGNMAVDNLSFQAYRGQVILGRYQQRLVEVGFSKLRLRLRRGRLNIK